jgi:tryptophan halogenase
MIIDNIAIVGGGTAGLVAALILRKTYPNLKIDLLESERIGIIGVGEGSTEHWRDFMIECNINLSELVRETDATFKYGINFVNWNGDNKNYIHSVSGNFNVESQTLSKVVYAHIIANSGQPKDLVHEYIEKSQHTEPYWTINQFHFNTFKLNQFLHKLCKERNINIINTEVENVILDENGYIKELSTSTQKKISYDFYVDCTGFHRLLLQKTMGIKWKSYSKYLPMNSAIAFPTERTEDIPSWTLSQALSSGWLWRIPTQERYGNGYVFNDNFISVDQAHEEVEKLYGHKVKVAKQVKFDAGCLEKFWHKNCAAIGLSSSFVEPLEASSIGCSIQQSFMLATAIASYVPKNLYAERTFNDLNDKLLTNILDFVALHYLVKRKDSKFWKSIETLPKPSGLEEKLEIFKHKFPSKGDFETPQTLFKAANWILVMHGLELIDPKIAKKELDMQHTLLKQSLSLNSKFNYDNCNFVSHRDALQWIMDNPEQR